MKRVTVDALDQWSGRIVDVRTLEEFASERLPGVECVPLDRLLTAAGEWDPGEPILLMCKSGLRSARGARRLEDAGFREVATLEGGIEACKKAGLDVIRQRKQIPIFRQVMITVGLVLAVLLMLTQVDARWIIVNWLVAAGLVFGGVTGYCPLAKVLESMPWNRVEETRSADCCRTGS